MKPVSFQACALFGVAILCGSRAVCGAMPKRTAVAPPSAVLRIVTDPPDALVAVDRVARGNSPLELADLAPGTHLVSITLRGHREWIESVSLGAGQRREMDVRLEPVRGTALILSEPAGVQVSIDGTHRGTTPLLAENLALGRYRVVLSAPGYQDCPLDLEVPNASPRRLSARLVTDSATLRVNSEPPGAELSVNGVPRGRTPAVLERIPDGDNVVELSLEGYAPYRQPIRLSAGDDEVLAIPLKPLPATLQVISLPAGARVYLGNEYRGEAPLTLEELEPGNQRVRVELSAHDIMARDVTLRRGARQVEEFRLVANCGSLRVVTSPAGVTVLVDGKVGGTTQAKPDATDQISDPLTVSMVPVGTREVTFTRQGFFEEKRTVVIERDRTATQEVALRRRFIPDYEVHTEANVYRGVLINITPEFVRLETEIGVIRAFPIDDIKSRRPLREDERTAPTPPSKE